MRNLILQLSKSSIYSTKPSTNQDSSYTYFPAKILRFTDSLTVTDRSFPASCGESGTSDNVIPVPEVQPLADSREL